MWAQGCVFGFRAYRGSGLGFIVTSPSSDNEELAFKASQRNLTVPSTRNPSIYLNPKLFKLAQP